MRHAAGVALAIALMLVPEVLAAQARRPAWELRADVILADAEEVVHAGAGFTVPLGTYARAVLAGGAGASFHDETTSFSGRGEALVRLTTDPFAETRRAVSVAAGVSLRDHADGDARADLVVVLGLDGRPRNGWAPALELGLGGGVRIGFALRQIRGNRR